MKLIACDLNSVWCTAVAFGDGAMSATARRVQVCRPKGDARWATTRTALLTMLRNGQSKRSDGPEGPTAHL
jgi:hypothetical protein